MSTTFTSLIILRVGSVPFNCLVAPDGFTRLDRHLVVSLWSAPENAPTVVIVDQKFIQIATARVSTRSCKPVLFTAVYHQSVVDVCSNTILHFTST